MIQIKGMKKQEEFFLKLENILKVVELESCHGTHPEEDKDSMKTDPELEEDSEQKATVSDEIVELITEPLKTNTKITTHTT
jgi:hypothetical protein